MSTEQASYEDRREQVNTSQGVANRLRTIWRLRVRTNSVHAAIPRFILVKKSLREWLEDERAELPFELGTDGQLRRVCPETGELIPCSQVRKIDAKNPIACAVYRHWLITLAQRNLARKGVRLIK